MSDKYNVYRAYAAFCQRMSRESDGEDRKLSWLQLAADWLALIRDSSSAEPESGITVNDGAGSTDRQRMSATETAPESPPAAAESAEH